MQKKLFYELHGKTTGDLMKTFKSVRAFLPLKVDRISFQAYGYLLRHISAVSNLRTRTFKLIENHIFSAITLFPESDSSELFDGN